MKTLKDHTKEELASLTDEDTKTLIQLTCAQMGAPLMVPEFPVEPEIKTFEGDINYARITFSVESSELPDVYAAIKDLTIYDVSSWSTRADKIETPLVERINIFSTSYKAQVAEEKSANERLQREYDSKLSEYNDASNGRQEAIDTVSEAIGNAHVFINANTRINDYHKECLSICDNDHNIALNFLRKRYHNEEITLAGIDNTLHPECPDEAMESSSEA